MAVRAPKGRWRCERCGERLFIWLRSLDAFVCGRKECEAGNIVQRPHQLKEVMV